MSTTTSTTHETRENQSWRHPVNVGHLVMGIAFLAIVGVWALVQGDVVDGADVRWLLPVPWVLAGLGGLLAVALAGGRRRSTRQTGGAGSAPETSPEPSDETEPSDEAAATDEAAPTEETAPTQQTEPTEENR